MSWVRTLPAAAALVTALHMAAARPVLAQESDTLTVVEVLAGGAPAARGAARGSRLAVLRSGSKSDPRAAAEQHPQARAQLVANRAEGT